MRWPKILSDGQANLSVYKNLRNCTGIKQDDGAKKEEFDDNNEE